MPLLDAAPLATARRAADLLAVLLRDDPTVADVSDVLRDYGEPEPIELHADDLAALQRVAQELHALFAAEHLAESVGILNRLLATYGSTPRLTAHLGTPWHLHADADDDGPWDEWLAASTALALATLVTERQADPTGLCASAGCGRPFVTEGRGVPQRYCSSRCATRERVAAHRAAHR